MKRQSMLTVAVGLVLATMSFGALAQDQTTHFTQADGTRVTLTSGQPPAQPIPAPPPFAQLDRNHDGYLSIEEARAYTPLLNDFEYAAHDRKRVSKAEYERWMRQLKN